MMLVFLCHNALQSLASSKDVLLTCLISISCKDGSLTGLFLVPCFTAFVCEVMGPVVNHTQTYCLLATLIPDAHRLCTRALRLQKRLPNCPVPLLEECSSLDVPTGAMHPVPSRHIHRWNCTCPPCVPHYEMISADLAELIALPCPLHTWASGARLPCISSLYLTYVVCHRSIPGIGSRFAARQGNSSSHHAVEGCV